MESLFLLRVSTVFPVAEGDVVAAFHTFTSAARFFIRDTATSYKLTAICSSVVLPPPYFQRAGGDYRKRGLGDVLILTHTLYRNNTKNNAITQATVCALL